MCIYIMCVLCVYMYIHIYIYICILLTQPLNPLLRLFLGIQAAKARCKNEIGQAVQVSFLQVLC
jgi:hypothetical protein